MSFNVSALSNYTKENEALLVTSSVLGAKTAALIQSAGNVMVGVKSAETINIMDTDAVFQAGGTCGCGGRILLRLSALRLGCVGSASGRAAS